MILKAPFQLRPDFLAAFGYRYGRRFVALYWEPCGDEAAYDDGVSSAIGMSDNWLFLGFIRQPEVRHWLDQNDIDLGSSDESGTHWLVADTLTNDLFAAPVREAYAVVHEQALPEAGPA